MTERSYHSRNYPLLIGGVISACIVVLAIIGPSLAPHDPLQEAGLLEVDGVYYGPPPFPRQLPPFRTAEYPLGHDDISRDLLSRLLWAVRPTLILCLVVMAARLLIGVLLGLIAGWWGGWPARIIDRLTSLSVALPLLAFAIGAIIALGLQRGLLTFVVALTLTSWSDTAALVKSRTQAVRSAPYIESARAIGIGQRGILWRHVLPQIVPLLPMLAAFELSAVLLLVAELGYLGYYIGGGYSFRYTVGNFDEHFLIRTGMPELGQMLSDFWGQLYRTPWVSIATGSLVAFALLGFALLGEGLRRHLDVTRPRRWQWRRSDPTKSATRPTSILRHPISMAVGGMLLLIALTVLWSRDRASTAASIAPDGTISSAATVASPSPPVVSTTPVPPDQFSAIDLATIALQPGDLPDTFTLFQTARRKPLLLDKAPDTTQMIDLSFKRNNVNAGRTTVLLYGSKSKRDQAFEAAIRVHPTTTGSSATQPLVGERRHMIDSGSCMGNQCTNNSGVLFTRCAAVVYINLTGTHDEPLTDLAQNYAHRLDARLAPLVCEPQ